jgi:hypothetical protein
MSVNLKAEVFRLAEEVHKCAINDEELIRECWRISRDPDVRPDGSAIFELVKITYDEEFARRL